MDFFTPIHQNPYIFGQITAANSLSDIFAVGGKVLNCLNVLAFPETVPEAVISEILSGAMAKVEEAGGVIMGGHTMTNDNIIYGLSVNGIVHKNDLKPNNAALPNQKIILTKRIGTGIYSKEINENYHLQDCKEVVRSMTTLNKTAAELANKYAVSALTDVTGFGLLGHLSEVLKASNISAEIKMSDIPLFERTRALAISHANGGMKRNNKYFNDAVMFNEDTNTQENKNILFDPQTSGGLLIFVDAKDSEKLIKELHNQGIKEAAIIGETKPIQEALIKVYR